MALEILPAAALAVSAIFLVVSGCVAWRSSFRPAKLVGVFPHLSVLTLGFTMGDHPTGEVCSRYIIPSFWLSNTGAQEYLIEDLRVTFRPRCGPAFFRIPCKQSPD